MSESEKAILKQAAEHPDGSLSEAVLINGIARQDRRSVENLIAKGYVEVEQRLHPGLGGSSYTINYYRVSEKGLTQFAPWYSRVWLNFKGDIRTITVSLITAVLTTIVMVFLSKFI